MSPTADPPARPAIAVRPLERADLPAVCGIVNHYIEHTTINFRTDPQTPAAWARRWSGTRATHPWFVATIDDAVRGVAYAGPWNTRAAYRWTAETTVYVAHDRRGQGAGRALYVALLEALSVRGFATTVAAISLPNPASVDLHESCGFVHVGTLRAVGFKLGHWCDVALYQRPARHA